MFQTVVPGLAAHFYACLEKIKAAGGLPKPCSLHDAISTSPEAQAAAFSSINVCCLKGLDMLADLALIC